jgi:hypothetical protein
MTEPTRLPLYAPLLLRDAESDKDSLSTNVFYDKLENTVYAVKRPGIETLITGSGQGQGIYVFDRYLFRWETNPYNWSAATFKEDSLLVVANLTTTAGGVSGLSLTGRTWEVGTYDAPIFSAETYLTTDGTTYTLYTATKVFQSEDGSNWEEVSTVSSGSGTTTLAWGGNLYVVTAGNGNFHTSPDGITWTSRSDADTNVMYTPFGNGLVYGNGKFVGIKQVWGAPGAVQCAYSTDGISWSTASMNLNAQTNPPSAICYGNGAFVVVSGGNPGGSSTGYYSTDGINWTETFLPIAQTWRSVAWNGSVFIAVGNTSVFAFSPDGINWYAGVIPFLTDFGIVAANPTTGAIIVITAIGATQAGYAKSTDNGANWTLGNLPSKDSSTGTITTL